ncbi:hypothetical protein EVAR_25509_1 [Eumeta japonica]|uniref:Uncharacterized protein n=1 Tax=Eumeta variegata TaxID=151549 RepID=A0A4C1VPJ9_EUMVA|nr:hypothetical protein EVAR_25509_1 [Eumeta japonica]
MNTTLTPQLVRRRLHASGGGRARPLVRPANIQLFAMSHRPCRSGVIGAAAAARRRRRWRGRAASHHKDVSGLKTVRASFRRRFLIANIRKRFSLVTPASVDTGSL